jgi:hypothetical protein
MFHRLAFLPPDKISHCTMECKEERLSNVDKAGLMISIFYRIKKQHSRPFEDPYAIHHFNDPGFLFLSKGE